MAENNCTTFVCDYMHTQFDPAHLLSELGFTIVFELVQLFLIALLWHKVIKPYLDRRHRTFDEIHGLHHETPTPPKPVCICPHKDTINGPGTGSLAGYTPGCPEHLPPGQGCPNPSCGETWLGAFKGTRCESCGWVMELIEETL